jgi:hypothetical protein
MSDNSSLDRAAQIRAAADQMRSVLAETIARADAVDQQIADLQAEREQILQKLESLVALGRARDYLARETAAIGAEVESLAGTEAQPEISKREQVFQTLLQNGAMTIQQISERLPEIPSIGSHLSILRKQRRILHVGNMWSILGEYASSKAGRDS